MEGEQMSGTEVGWVDTLDEWNGNCTWDVANAL